MTKTAFRSHMPAKPALRDSTGNEICGRCGTGTREWLLTKGRRDQLQIMIECPACGKVRPASER